MIQSHSYEPIPENMTEVLVFISWNTGVNKTHLLTCPKVLALMYMYIYPTTIISMKHDLILLYRKWTISAEQRYRKLIWLDSRCNIFLLHFLNLQLYSKFFILKLNMSPRSLSFWITVSVPKWTPRLWGL